jgi:hypothetical protein
MRQVKVGNVTCPLNSLSLHGTRVGENTGSHIAIPR